MARGKSITKELVLSKAVEIARTESIEAVAYNRLARELDIRPQSMYRYYANLKELQIALLSYFISELVQTLTHAVQDQTPREALRSFGITLYDECHREPCYYQAFTRMHTYGIVSEMVPALHPMIAIVQGQMAQLFEEPADIERYTQCYMALMLGYAQMAINEFMPQSLKDNRRTYMKSLEDFIEKML